MKSFIKLFSIFDRGPSSVSLDLTEADLVADLEYGRG